MQRVVELVEELVEEAVQGLSTLSRDTLRWLRSPKLQEPDVRPFSRMQNKASQLRAAQLWARLLCYCLRVVAVNQAPAAPAALAAPAVPKLASIARLFPWHGNQKLAAERLWKYLSQSNSSATTTAKQRTYVLRLSHALICQELYGQPFNSAIVHFLAALGIHPETSRLRTAPEFSSMLGSLVYCIRALAIEIFLPVDKRAEQGAIETKSFLEQRARYLVDGSYSPMSVMISLLAYAKFIALRTPGSSAGSI